MDGERRVFFSKGRWGGGFALNDLTVVAELSMSTGGEIHRRMQSLCKKKKKKQRDEISAHSPPAFVLRVTGFAAPETCPARAVSSSTMADYRPERRADHDFVGKREGIKKRKGDEPPVAREHKRV